LGHSLRWHSLLRHRLLRVCRIARLGLARISLRLLRVATLPPGGSWRHAGLAWLTGRGPALRGSLGRRSRVLAGWRPLLRLPGWRLAWSRLVVRPIDRGDRPLLVWRDVGR
jgi:hypothetical protein